MANVEDLLVADNGHALDAAGKRTPIIPDTGTLLVLDRTEVLFNEMLDKNLPD